MTSAIGSGAHSGLTIAKVAQVLDIAKASIQEAHTAIGRYGTEAVVIKPRLVGRSQATISVAALREIAVSSRTAYESALQANALVQAAVERLDIPLSVRDSVNNARSTVNAHLENVHAAVKMIEQAKSVVNGIPEIHDYHGSAEKLKEILIQSNGYSSGLFDVHYSGNKHQPLTLLNNISADGFLQKLKDALLTAESVAATRVETSHQMKERLASIDPALVATFEGVMERPVATAVAAIAVPIHMVDDAAAIADEIDVATIGKVADSAPAPPAQIAPDTSWMENIVMPTPPVRPDAATDQAILDRAVAVMRGGG